MAKRAGVKTGLWPKKLVQLHKRLSARELSIKKGVGKAMLVESQYRPLPGMEEAFAGLLKAKRRLISKREGLERVARQRKQIELAGKAVEKELQKGFRDKLTGLPNRRFAHEILPAYFAQIERARKQIAFVGIDLINFREINNKISHREGDVSLKQTARVLKNSVRRTDPVLRWGGDEFFVILNGKNALQGAGIVLNKINEALAQYSLSRSPLRKNGIVLQARWRVHIAKPPASSKVFRWLNLQTAEQIDRALSKADPKKKKR